MAGFKKQVPNSKPIMQIKISSHVGVHHEDGLKIFLPSHTEGQVENVGC